MRSHRMVAPGLLACAGLMLTAGPAGADECPTGQVADGYTGQCVIDIEPISFFDAPEGVRVRVGPTYPGGQVPTVNGIPCTPEHLGTCIGMSYNQGPHSGPPQAVISHSP